MVYGLVQGAGAELGFAADPLPPLRLGDGLLAAVTAGLSTSILDLSLYYPVSGTIRSGVHAAVRAFTVLSSVLLAGVVGCCWSAPWPAPAR